MVRLARVNLRTVRGFSSALYVTGDKAQSNFVVLTPHIDFEEQIKNKGDLVKSITARKLPVDLDKLEKRWNFFKMIDDNKTVLELTKTEIGNLITKLKQEDADKNKGEIEKLFLHLKLVKDDLKNVKEYSYGIEENANLAVLGLPNFLHSRTPIDSAIILHEFSEKPDAVSKNHVEIGKLYRLIDYRNPNLCFFKSDAALFEFSITNYFQSLLLENGLTQFSNADFARSVIVEGCGGGYLDKNQAFTLGSTSNDEINRLHLVGGASLYAFMAYFAKHIIQTNVLPLKLFTLGRKYAPKVTGTDLFTLSQNTVAQIFIATDEKTDEIFDSLVEKIINIYEPLGYHFRLVYAPAVDLKPTESLRMSVEMFSNYSQKYVEVGYLSLHDDYISKRLLFTHGKERKFIKIISGEMLSVQKLLGCVLENNYVNETPLLSTLLQKYL